MNPAFRGIITENNGVYGIKVDRKDALEAWLKTLYPKSKNGIEIVVKKWLNTRSQSQNRYYWGVIIKMIGDEQGEIDQNKIHALLKSLFLKGGVEVNGKRYEIIKDTHDLDTIEFEDYCEKCRQWASQELNLYIPLPNEVEE